MKKGDLVHIPQAVLLWTPETQAIRAPYMQTKKPTTAIYMGVAANLDLCNLLTVFVNGRIHFVHSKDVYLFKEKYASKTNRSVQ